MRSQVRTFSFEARATDGGTHGATWRISLHLLV